MASSYSFSSSSLRSDLERLKQLSDRDAALALQELKPLYRKLTKEANTYYLARCLYIMGNCFLKQASYAQVKKTSEQLRQLAQPLDDHAMCLKALYQSGSAYLGEGDYREAFIRFHDALGLSRRLGHVRDEAIILNQLGLLYSISNSFDQALEYFLESLSFAEALSTNNLHQIYSNLGLTYRELGQFKQAVTYTLKAVDQARKWGEIRTQVLALIRLSELYRPAASQEDIDGFPLLTPTLILEAAPPPTYIESTDLVSSPNDPKTSWNYLYEAITLVKGHRLSDLYVITEKHSAEYYQYYGKTKNAQKHYQNALDYLQKTPNRHQEAELRLSLAKYYQQQEQHQKALSQLQSALLLTYSSQKYLRARIYHALYRNYKKLEDHVKSLESFEAYHTIVETLHSERAEQRVHMLMVKFEIDRLKCERELERQYAEQLALKNNELAQANLKLEELSVRDGLTNLHNRRYVDDYLAQAYPLAQRHGHPLSVMVADIDFFKQVNDKFSHSTGDKVLKMLAKLLLNNVRQSDTVARYGGEEFVLVFPQTNLENALLLTEQLRYRIEQHPWHTIDNELQITISAGVACNNALANHEKLLNLADKKLYEAKHSGKNRVCG